MKRQSAFTALMLLDALTAANAQSVTAPENPPPLPRSFTAPEKLPPPPNTYPGCPYSDAAFRARAEGAVTLFLDVTDGGQVGNVYVVQSSGNDALDESAVACAEAWKFKPATMNGKPIAVRTEYQIKFMLRDARMGPPRA